MKSKKSARSSTRSTLCGTAGCTAAPALDLIVSAVLGLEHVLAERVDLPGELRFLSWADGCFSEKTIHGRPPNNQ